MWATSPVSWCLWGVISTKGLREGCVRSNMSMWSRSCLLQEHARSNEIAAVSDSMPPLCASLEALAAAKWFFTAALMAAFQSAKAVNGEVPSPRSGILTRSREPLSRYFFSRLARLVH